MTSKNSSRLAANRRRTWLGAGACTCLVALLSVSDVAHAQTSPGVDLRSFHAPADPRAVFVAEPVDTLRAGVVALGLNADYNYLPLTLKRDDGSVIARPLTHQLIFDLHATVGIGERLALFAQIPASLQASGAAPVPASVASGVPAFAVGDPSIGAKVRLRDNASGGVGVAARGGLTLPVGARSAFTGERGLRVSAGIIVDYSFLVAGVQGQLGFLGRTVRPEWPADSPSRVSFGNELPWAFATWFKPEVAKLDPDGRQRWEVAVRGSLPLGPAYPFGAGAQGSAARSPVLLSFGDRIELGKSRDFAVSAGVEFGLSRAVGVPAFGTLLGLSYAPSLHDRDGDGIPDATDQCPDIPEDLDGFEDSDGCPDIDDDGDDIPDKVDACPRVAGVPSKDPKKNGCPAVDSDGDGIPDDQDSCPKLRGDQNDEAGCNGCPDLDPDGDGILAPYDRCPNEAEDRDGFQDEDGCPDPDNDRDGIDDIDDACPNVKGVPSKIPGKNGCPSPDIDGDTILNENDQCPTQAETWNGVLDGDGCAEATPARWIVEKRLLGGLQLTLPRDLEFDAKTATLLPASEPLLRAIATAANQAAVTTPTIQLFFSVRAAPKPDKPTSERTLAEQRAIQAMLDGFVKAPTPIHSVDYTHIEEALGTKIAPKGRVVFFLVDQPSRVKILGPHP